MSARHSLLALAVLPALAATVGAQTLRGVITRDGARVEGAVVLLVDSAGRVAGRAVSGESGAFTVAADRAGSYRVRALRIGYAPTLAGPVRLAEGAAATLEVRLTGVAVRIAELRVVERASCDVRPDSDAVAFRLWEQARTALLATTLTQREPLTMRTSATRRTLDAGGERVLADSIEVRTVPTVRPFASLPPDSLAAGGYVRRSAAGEIVYWAPDADVLLSDSFAASHCLRAERAPADTGAEAQWVGIAFLPSGGARGVADVEGVLWLDRGTGELRRLDYRYASLPDFARGAERARPGGRVEFLRLSTGDWIVPRWTIRHPLLRPASARGPAPVVPGMRRESPGERSAEVAGLVVAGGEVAEVRRGVRTIWERGRVGYRVRVVDAESRRPIPEAMVAMDEPRDTATTDATGVALLPRVVPGAHRVAVRSPVMTLLGTPPLELMVAVAGQQDEPSPLELPSERTLLARACGAPSAARREALLRGSLRTTALPVADARVEAAWEARYVRLGGGAAVTVPRRVVATTDARGAFTMCGLPRGVPITLRAVRGRSDERATTTTIPAQAVAVEERVVVEP